VESLGEEVTEFQINDEVYAMADLFKAGGYAEYIVINAKYAALKPKTLNFEEAASVPLAALTAWQALFDEGKLTENQRVLIHAASGGVGSFAVQLAKAKGAYVIATTSSHNIELVKNLGADEVIDYTQSDFSTHVSNVDVVLDPVGGDTQERSFACLKPGGKLVTIVALNHPDKGTRILVKPNGERLAEIAALIDQGKVKPLIDRIMMLKEVQEAHELSEAGHARGKIVLRVSK
jgi:NADPH:quinone reductase-like Zn-dependent oxidoreductase